jgi:AhpD family alkylhydroperoxidase
MTVVHVFDPAMCCSTGICGPAVDPQLVRFAADLDWLKSQGVAVERFNLSQEPAAFAADADVRGELETKGADALPLVKVNGKVQSVGAYPTRTALAAWAGVGAPSPSIFTESVAELVALGAAIASNCESCFKYHYDKARKLGVSRDDMLQAVAIAQGVKDAPAKSITDLAHRILKAEGAAAAPTPSKPRVLATLAVAADAPTGACCTPAAAGAGGDKKSGCC